ncbi:MAG: type II toxin-antitoxin system prevent-host-death family antitoxin [Acidobacteria bacterium]|nr:type II toxin-antitoxin system prevent-host-death family antitoxin [Acidobacteriota bacterium]
MLVAAVGELKARLSGFLRRVKAGEEVLVTERGRPIARIVRVAGPAEAESRVADLAAGGLVRLGTGRLGRGFWDAPRPADPEGRALAGLLAERAEGR